MDNFVIIGKIVKRILENFIERIIGYLLFGMVIITFIAVVSRYLFNRPVMANEELARLFMIWMILFGSIVNTRKHDQLRVTFLFKLLPLKAQRFLEVISDVILIIIMFYFIYYGIILVSIAQKQYTTVLQIPWSFVYSVIPISATGILLYYVRDLINLFKNSENKGDRA